MNSAQSSPSADALNTDSVVVLTGVGGVVGRPLIDELQRKGHQLRVLSRDPETLKSWLPDSIKSGSYDQMEEIFNGASALVHLAARNNDQGGTWESFEQDNVGLPIKLADAAKRSGLKKFIFASTTKALSNKGGDYGRSKAIAERELVAISDSTFNVSVVRLCPVYGGGAQTRGRIRKLENLPLGFGKLALWLVRSLVPVVSAKRVAQGIGELIESNDPVEELCIADPVGKFSVYGLFVAILNFVFVLAVPTILGIPCLIAAVLVAITSAGGVFFIQQRLGRKLNPFQLCKFRTMFVGTPSAGTHEVGKSYVTKVGSFLRKSKLDELPQAWNVLKREINLIGPRPGLENQTELTKQRQRYGVFDIKPGITGFGQVSGVDMSEPKRLAIHDHRYSAFRAISLDVKIILKTILGGGFGDPVGGERASATQEKRVEESSRPESHVNSVATKSYR